jgi:glycosyltransferase involved in cell wall biosynthesis
MTARRVMYLSHSAELSGAELSLIALMSSLDRSRYQPLAVIPGAGPLLDRLVEAGIPAHVLPLTPGSVRRPGGILRNLRLIRSFIREQRVGIIHANSFHAIKQAAPWRRLDPTPLVGHIRDIVPFTRLTRAAILSCDRVVCVSAAAAANLGVGQASRASGRVRVIHNGVDPATLHPLPARAEALEALGLGAIDGPTVGMAAPLVRWKGQELFLRAAARVAEKNPSATFILAGSDRFAEPGYVDALHAAAGRGSLAGRVRFAGFAKSARDLFAALDILVCASLDPDPLPRAVLEAMTAGVAVVGSAAGGLPEAVEDGVSGLLVAPGDSDALADAIARLLDDDTLRLGIARAARAAATAKFSLTAHTDRVMSLYEEILAP